MSRELRHKETAFLLGLFLLNWVDADGKKTSGQEVGLSKEGRYEFCTGLVVDEIYVSKPCDIITYMPKEAKK